MKADLSKSDLIATLDIIHACLTCQSIKEYNELVEKAQTLLFFDHFRSELADTGNKKAKPDMEEADSVGLKEGWLCSKHGQRSSACAVLSLAGEKFAKNDRSRIILDYLAPHLCLVIKRINLHQKKLTVRLSPRECEVLSWTAAGKTAWETSVILDISRRTVEFHMGNILNKLDAVNSQHAIAIALSSGMIEY